MKHLLVRLTLLAAFALLVAACASSDSGTVTEDTTGSTVPGAAAPQGNIAPGTSMTGPSASVGW